MPYFWFHAFRRDSVADILAVLRNGATPRLGGTTAHNEETLAIAPPCVYTYLGQTFEEFGDCAVTVPMDALRPDARVSPFDTGGLVGHLDPVKGWTVEAKRSFLGHFTWPANELPNLLAQYPTNNAGRRGSYLRGERPPHAGPHEIFLGDAEDETRVAAIWQNGTRSCAWLWEARSPGQLELAPHLFRWSCSNTTYDAILRYVEDLGGQDADWIASLIERYVPGGVSALVVSLLPAQEAA
jgi:hypothetical protein